MAHLYDKVLAIVRQDPGQRLESDIDQILPWFRKKSELFKSLPSEIMRDIVKNCQFESCKKDHVIIRQGEKGNCFYIILSGSVAIHIITNLTEEEFKSVRERQLEEEALIAVEGPKGRALDRSKYGNYIGKITTGKSFGELALINNDCVRNASIIADEDCHLLVVDRDLYNRCLRTYQRQEFEEKMAFVDTFPLFQNWQAKYKKMMAMSLHKTSVKFEDVIIKQGAPVDGLLFILSGQLKIVIDPSMHQSQYPDIFPSGSVADLEREKTRELLRKEMNLERHRGAEKKPTFQKKKPHTEGKKGAKPVELCIMRAIDMIGDLELVSGLSTYCASVVCAEAASLYVLDQRNFDRLLEKRNPQSMAVMRTIVHAKLALHFTRIQESRLPLLRYILYTLDEGEKRKAEALVQGKPAPGSTDKDAKPAPLLWQADTMHRGPLIDLHGPGSVFHMIRLREKERKKQLAQQAQPKPTFRFGMRPTGTQLLQRPRPPQPPQTGRPSINVTAFDSDGEGGEGEEVKGGSGGLVGGSPRIVPQISARVQTKQRPKSASDAGEPRTFRHGGGGRDGFQSGSDSEDECLDWATSDYVLSRLEDRIQQWHSRFEEPPATAATSTSTASNGGVSGTSNAYDPLSPQAVNGSSSNNASNSRSTSPSRTVKLHRYQLVTEDKRPRPGNKVYLRLRPRPPNVNFLALLEQEQQQRQITSEPSPRGQGAGGLLSRGRSATDPPYPYPSPQLRSPPCYSSADLSLPSSHLRPNLHHQHPHCQHHYRHRHKYYHHHQPHYHHHPSRSVSVPNHRISLTILLSYKPIHLHSCFSLIFNRFSSIGLYLHSFTTF